MFSPISPELVYVIHKEKERELEQQIEYIRIAREQAARERSAREWAATGTGSIEEKLGWFAQAARWAKEKLTHAPARQPEPINRPCSGIPC